MPVHIKCLRYADNHIIGAVKLVVLISYHCYPVNANKVCKVVAEQVPFLSVKSNLLTDSGIVADSSQGVNKVEHWFSVIIKDHERCVIEVSIANEILMYFRAQKKLSCEVSINETIDTDKDGNPLTFSDIICSDDTIVDDIESKIYSKKAIEIIKTALSPRERRIIVLRYGLNNQKPRTQRQIAEMLDISRSYVSRIEKAGIEKIRAEFKRCGFGDYM